VRWKRMKKEISRRLTAAGELRQTLS
jgi:hypothetical protein